MGPNTRKQLPNIRIVDSIRELFIDIDKRNFYFSIRVISAFRFYFRPFIKINIIMRSSVKFELKDIWRLMIDF